MNAHQAKAKSKDRDAKSTENHSVTTTKHTGAALAGPVGVQAKAFYAAPPVPSLSLGVQTKVAIGRVNDPYEREADAVADHIETGRPVRAVSTLPAGGLGAAAQRQEEESEEPTQMLSIQRQAEEESEESAQTDTMQRQEESETEEGEQAAQKQEEQENDESTQTSRVQRQEEESEEPTQTFSVQRQAEEEPEESAQTASIRKQGEASDEKTLQQSPVQRKSEETIQERSSGAQGPPASASMRAAATHAIHSRGAGEPLNPATRKTLESGFGADLGEVRVHENSSDHQAAGALKARAFTHRNHIWLGQGQSQNDVRLMAHETTHVLQQGGIVRRKPADEPDEKEEEKEEKESAPPKSETTESSAEATTSERPETEPPPLSSAATKIKENPPAGTELPSIERPTTHTAKEPIQVDRPFAKEPEEKPETAHEQTPAKPESGEAVESKERPGEESETARSEPTPTPESGASGLGAKAEETKIEKGQVEKSGEAVPEVKAGEKSAVEAQERKAEAPPTSPSPEEDDRFQGVMKRVNRQAKNEQAHEPGAKKIADARAASIPPENDRESRAQAKQVDVMDKQEAKKPENDDFLSLLYRELEKIAPKNMEETLEFKKKGKAGQLKAALTSKVSEQKKDSSKDIQAATKAQPDPDSVEAKPVTAMPAEEQDPAKANLRSRDVLALPKKKEEISVDHNKKKAEQLMAENDVDEEQLKEANEPQFSDALKAKKELDSHADKVPQRYREEEQGYLDKTTAEVKQEEISAKALMRAQRNKGQSRVRTRQELAKKKEEEERKKVADQVQKMYQTTKTNVEKKLGTLDKEVVTLFDAGEKKARDHFESYVDLRMRAYKFNRYVKRFGGPALWLKDKLTSMPDEVNEFYKTGSKRYKMDMSALFLEIGNTVETRLKEAKEEIAKGKKEIKNYVENLPKDLRKAGQEAEKEVASEFAGLEDSVDSKKKELVRKMVRRYQDSRKKLNERIQELKKENQGLVDAFIGKIKEVIEILRNFKNKIMSLMKQGGDVIRKIVKKPGKFLHNLLDALKKGFNQFSDNFLKHLKAAFINWLFGTMSKAGIEMPSEFTFKSVFGLILQVIGISKDWIRSRVVKMIGAKNVERVEKAWSIVSTLISGGIGGLWEKAKQFLGDLKDQLFDTIQSWLITQIVKQAIIWVISLFNPVAALLKIIKMIYDIVMFFVENIDRILQLVQTVIQSAVKIVAGNIAAAANWIEKAMAQTLPIIIAFLARLLGISGIANNIRSFIKKIQKKVRGVVDKILKKIVGGIKKFIGKSKTFGKIVSGSKKFIRKGKAFGKKVVGKGKVAVKKVAGKLKALFFPIKRFKKGNETHTILAVKSGGKHKIVVKSETLGVEAFIKHADKVAQGNSSVTKKTAKLDTDYGKWKNLKETNQQLIKAKEKGYSKITRQIVDIMKMLPNTQVPPSVIHWDPLDQDRAKGVTADPLTYKGSEGSPPIDHIDGWDTGFTFHGKKVAYIRAHLLHHKLHGPGKKFNMTPTSSRINQLMYNRVEKPALIALGIRPNNNAKKGRVVLTYTVRVSYQNTPPPGLSKAKQGIIKNVAKKVEMHAKGKDLATGKQFPVGDLDEENY